MNEPKWTPGPWVVHKHFALVVPYAHKDRRVGGSEEPEQDKRIYAQEICAVRLPDRHRPECESRANADLMASAPDLYQELETAREYVASVWGNLKGAAGEDNLVKPDLDRIDAALAKARGETE